MGVGRGFGAYKRSVSKKAFRIQQILSENELELTYHDIV